MGGIANGRDAFEFILAGAHAVSVGTATFGNPTAAISIKNELEAILIEKGFGSVEEAIGYAHREVAP